MMLDSIGELARVYKFAAVAFVGGSLVPTGGHNPIEPAAAGVPVAFGPHMSNFREIASEALASTFEVKEAATLAEARAHLAAGRIDLMVLDLTLGGGETGLEFLRSLPAKPCPILIYTNEDESEMYGEAWEELQRLGADDILMKGMNAGEMVLRKASTLLGLPWNEDE